MTYSARVVADSIADRVRLTTLEVVMPRIILAEFNTHRVFSRNSASSRAVPTARRIEQVEKNPFVPAVFGANQRGMQAGDALTGTLAAESMSAWLDARYAAVKQAKKLNELGVHKQLANRLLEPFLWHKVVVTATEWANFFALRDHEAAQPEMQITARLMKAAMGVSPPMNRLVHLPYVTDDERAQDSLEIARAKSVVRCAAVSFDREAVER